MSLPPANERLLIQIAQNRCGSYDLVSTDAFTALFQEHAPLLRRITFRHLQRSNIPLAEARMLTDQIVSDVFLVTGFDGPPMRYFTRFEGFHVGPDSFQHFLGSYRYRLTANAIKSYWKNHRHTRLTPTEALQDQLAEERLSMSDRLLLAETLQGVSPEDQLLLKMWSEGHAHGAIAEILGLGAAACRKRLSRLLQDLRDSHYSESLDEEG